MERSIESRMKTLQNLKKAEKQHENNSVVLDKSYHVVYR
ncbi:protein of unknown function [Ruminococcaceae bacterium BL-4]|nr:protein of unknown function [Ruminococcaceae bacterium BL-4]